MTQPPTFDELVDNAVAQIIRAFGKGEDLRGACWAIVNGTARWVIAEEERRKLEKK